MGLFNRKPKADPAEVAALRSELAEMRDLVTRVNATAADRAAAATSASHDGAQRLGELQARLDSAMAHLAELRQLQSRLDEAESATSRLVSVDHLEARVAATEAATGRLDQLAAVPARLDELAAVPAQLEQLSAHLAETTAAAAAAREHAASLDARLNEVSTQLTNQLAELGREIDSHAAPAAAPVPTSEAVVEQLRSGQVRLANEQARFEIAFREDLATLAEQVRLLRGR